MLERRDYTVTSEPRGDGSEPMTSEELAAIGKNPPELSGPFRALGRLFKRIGQSMGLITGLAALGGLPGITGASGAAAGSAAAASSGAQGLSVLRMLGAAGSISAAFDQARSSGGQGLTNDEMERLRVAAQEEQLSIMVVALETATPKELLDKYGYSQATVIVSRRTVPGFREWVRENMTSPSRQGTR